MRAARASCLLLLAAAAAAQIPVPELSHRLHAVDPPRPAPAFELEDMDGGRHSLAGYRGKVVVLNFWATWCPPCRREMPSMEAVYQALKQDGLVVLAVNQGEDPDDVFAYMGQLPLFPSFPILFDRDSGVSQAYRVRGLPTTYIIDKRGRIVYRAIGGRDFAHPEVEALLRALLQQPSP